jgi:hypothetical protein
MKKNNETNAVKNYNLLHFYKLQISIFKIIKVKKKIKIKTK